MDKYSMNFGKKERVLNYACQTYQLSRPNKVRCCNGSYSRLPTFFVR